MNFYKTIEKVSRALVDAGDSGMTKAAIRARVGRPLIQVALGSLEAKGVARKEIKPSPNGRLVEVWFSVGGVIVTAGEIERGDWVA